MNPGLILLLLGGVYLLYQASQTPATTTTTTSASAPPQTGGTPAGGRMPVTTTTSQPSAPPPPSTAGSLSGALASLTALETSMVGVDPAIQAGLVASYDVHNYYLGQVLGTTNLPDSGVTMGAKGTVPVLSLSQYWGVIAPWLAANRGMSGTGRSKIRVKVPATMSKGWR